MNGHSVGLARPLIAVPATVALGVFIGFVVVLASTLVRPVLPALALGGLVLLLPTFVLRDPKAYWLFLLALSIPFDISKRTTSWIIEPWVLSRDYGLQASGTFSIDLYLTDIVLMAMILPWLARLSRGRERFFFPKIGYIFVLYLAWALTTSMITAQSFYLAIFEWCREALYFVSFLYLINNLITRSHFRAIVLALFVGLAIEAATVITFFELGIGTETFALAGLYRDQEDPIHSYPSIHIHYEAESGQGSQTKRSAGTFVHPSLAAYYFEFTLFVVLGYLITAGRRRDQILLGALFGSGCLALYLTFSRSGLVGFIGGCIVFFAFARWSRLMSQQAFTWFALVFGLSAILAGSLVVQSLISRPKAASMRLELIERGMNTYWQRPIFGAGLNNSSAVQEGSRKTVITNKGVNIEASNIHNYYLNVLIEVGLGGFILFFGFFWQIVGIGLRSMRTCDTEMKLLLVGVVGSLGSIAIHNFGDPFGGHVTHAMLWLLAGVIIAISRRVQPELRHAWMTRGATSRPGAGNRGETAETAPT